MIYILTSKDPPEPYGSVKAVADEYTTTEKDSENMARRINYHFNNHPGEPYVISEGVVLYDHKPVKRSKRK